MVEIEEWFEHRHCMNIFCCGCSCEWPEFGLDVSSKQNSRCNSGFWYTTACLSSVLPGSVLALVVFDHKNIV